MLDRMLRCLGVDPDQYRVLIRSGVAADSRAENSVARYDLGKAVLLAMYLLIGLVMSLSAPALPSFSFTFLMLGFMMVMMGLIAVQQLEGFIMPGDYFALAHMPISSRTYFLAKLTRFLMHVLLVAVLFNLPPSVLGLWSKDASPFFPAAYFPLSLVASLHVSLLMASLYGLLVRLYQNSRLRDMVAYSQMVVLLLLLLSFMKLPQWALQISTNTLSAIEQSEWFYILPVSWFSGWVHLILGDGTSDHFLLAAMALVSTASLAVLITWRIASGYTERLSYMAEVPARRNGAKIRASIMASILRNPGTRAGFGLVAQHLRRDPLIRIRLSIALAAPIMMVVGAIKFLTEHQSESFQPEWAIGVGLVVFSGATYLISAVLSALQFSADWQAAWVIGTAPLDRPREIFRGVKVAIVFHIVIPLFTILGAIGAFFLGPLLTVAYMLPSFVWTLCYLSVDAAWNISFPLQLAPETKKWNVSYPTLILGWLTFALISGGQYLALQTSLRPVYPGLYIAVLVLGIVLFLAQERRGARCFDEHAVNRLLNKLSQQSD